MVNDAKFPSIKDRSVEDKVLTYENLLAITEKDLQSADAMRDLLEATEDDPFLQNYLKAGDLEKIVENVSEKLKWYDTRYGDTKWYNRGKAYKTNASKKLFQSIYKQTRNKDEAMKAVYEKYPELR